MEDNVYYVDLAIGKRIKELREEAGITQEELATKAQTDEDLVHFSEKGFLVNDNIFIIKIANVLKSGDWRYIKYGYSYDESQEGLDRIRNELIAEILTLDYEKLSVIRDILYTFDKK